MTRGDWQKSAILNSCSHYTQSPSALFQDNQEGDPQNSRDPVGKGGIHLLPSLQH